MSTTSILTTITGLGAAAFLAFGVWPFVDPQSFFDEVAAFEPYNAHFLHDIGAFQIGIGTTLALALWRRSDAIFVALGGAGVGAAFHAFAHFRDHDQGGADSDVYVFTALATLLLGAAAWQFLANGLRRAALSPPAQS